MRKHGVQARRETRDVTVAARAVVTAAVAACGEVTKRIGEEKRESAKARIAIKERKEEQ